MSFTQQYVTLCNLTQHIAKHDTCCLETIHEKIKLILGQGVSFSSSRDEWRDSEGVC